jgi:methyl-accepting chemotaxis protein
VNSRLEVKSTSVAILPAIILTNIITAGIVSIAAVIVVLFISHKIAGPMHRFEKEIKNIGKGDISRGIVLREEDQFEKIAQALDEMVASLREKVSAIRGAVDQTRAKVEANDMGNDDLKTELQQLIALVDSNFKR